VRLYYVPTIPIDSDVAEQNDYSLKTQTYVIVKSKNIDGRAARLFIFFGEIISGQNVS